VAASTTQEIEDVLALLSERFRLKVSCAFRLYYHGR
jgi:hypothetical protein